MEIEVSNLISFSLDASNLARALQAILERIGKNGTKIDFLSKTQEDFSVTINNFGGRLGTVEKQGVAHEASLNKLTERMDGTATKEELEALRQTVADLSRQLQAQGQAAARDREEAEKRISQEAEARAAKDKADAEAKAQALAGEVERLERQLRDAREKIDRAQDSIDTFKANALSQVSERLAQLEKGQRELKGKMASLGQVEAQLQGVSSQVRQMASTSAGTERGQAKEATGEQPALKALPPKVDRKDSAGAARPVPSLRPSAARPGSAASSSSSRPPSSSGSRTAVPSSGSDAAASSAPTDNKRLDGLEDRVLALDDDVGSLKAAVAALRNRLDSAPVGTTGKPATSASRAASDAAAPASASAPATAPASSDASGSDAGPSSGFNAASPSSSSSAPSSGRVSNRRRQHADCENCPDEDIKLASVACQDCAKRLCSGCDDSVHEPARMRAHRRTALAQGDGASVPVRSSHDAADGDSSARDRLAALEARVAPLAQRVTELAQAGRDMHKELVEAAGGVAKLQRQCADQADQIESLRNALAGRPAGDGQGADQPLRDYVDVRLRDISNKLTRMEHEHLNGLADTVRAQGAQINALSNAKADKTALAELAQKLKSLQDEVKRLSSEVSRLQSGQVDADKMLNKLLTPRLSTNPTSTLPAGSVGGVAAEEVEQLRYALARLELRLDGLEKLLHQHLKDNHGQELLGMRSDIAQLRQRLSALSDAKRDSDAAPVSARRAAPAADSNASGSGSSSGSTAAPSSSSSSSVSSAELDNVRDQLASLAQLLDALKSEFGGFKAWTQDEVLTGAKRVYVDQQLRDLDAKLKQLEKATPKNVKSELKRFERDVVLLVEQAQQQQMHHHHASETALGRAHFRCLVCDSVTATQPGPESRLQYDLTHTRSLTAGELAAMADRPHLLVEKGEPITLHGKDGQVFKGREDSRVQFLAPGGKDNHFAVTVRSPTSGRGAGPSRPNSRGPPAYATSTSPRPSSLPAIQ